MTAAMLPGAFLSLLQLSDSAFPVGMYAHSHGLEGMVREGLIRSAEDVESLLRNQLLHSVLPSDGAALVQAHGAILSRVLEIDRLLFAMKLPAELRAASCQVGRR